MSNKDILTSPIEMADVIKNTGFPVPESLENETFAEAVSKGIELEVNKKAVLISNGQHVIHPSAGKEAMSKVTVTVSVPNGYIKLYGYTFEDTVLYSPVLASALGTGTSMKVLFASDENLIQVSAVSGMNNTISYDGDTYTRDSSEDITL